MNTLQFLLNLQQSKNKISTNNTPSNNRMNSMGEALELYIRNIYCGYLENLDEDNLDYTKCFSYIGNKTNPPDLMLKGSDAIEIKKIEGISSDLALNSSNPKDKLHSNNLLITKTCQQAEKWVSKDMLYIIGNIDKKTQNLSKLWLVYGDCYCAETSHYEEVKLRIKQGVEQIPNVEFSETKELGRINKIDPLGITNLRMRGMWTISHPVKVFKYLDTDNFDVNCILLNSKYLGFEKADRQKIEINQNIKISDVKIKNPNNPAQLLDAKLIQMNLCL